MSKPNTNQFSSKARKLTTKCLLLLYSCFAVMYANAQQRTITGKVISEGKPVPGVTVQIKNAPGGTSSDDEGRFSITVPSASSTLIFSSIGYVTKEQSANATGSITVTLEPELKSQDEIVVIGYGTARRGDLTGSVGSIKSEELNRQKAPSFLEAMQGKVAGVNITSQSGEPGSGVSINIRGANSLNASSQPLYVIDGIQIDPNSNEMAVTNYASDRSTYNPLASINPADIESIEILKDASATAIFGSRGANGVVVVKTKSGRKGALSVEYDGNAGITKMLRRIPVLNSRQYSDYMHWRNPTDSAFGTGVKVDGRFPEPRYYPELTDHDWQDEIYRTGIMQSHNVSISGGNEKMVYSGGIGYYKQNGIVENNSFDKFSGRLKIDVTPSTRFKYGVNFDYGFSNANGLIGQTGPNSYTGVPAMAVVTRPLTIPRSGENPATILPADNLIKFSDKKVFFDRLLAQLYGEYAILKDLRFRMEAGINRTNSKGDEFYSKKTDWGFNYNGFARMTSTQSLAYFQRNMLTYDKQLNENHRLNVLAAFEINGYNFQTFAAQNNNFADESTGYHDISKGVQPQIPTSYFEESRLASYLGRINYSLFDRYLFTVSLRTDGSSKFGTENKFGYFPSAALAWKVNEENFFKNVKAVDELKLRASFGATGNDRLPAYSGAPRMQSSNFPSNDVLVFGLAPFSPENMKLKWETTVQTDFGIDLAMFKRRVTLTADVYYKTTNDMLLQVAVPAQSGYISQWQNLGRLENKGLELTVNTINVSTEKFNWNTSFNISFNKNEILDLGKSKFLNVSFGGGWHNDVGRLEVGRSIGSMYGFKFDGIYQVEDFTWQNNSDPSIPDYQRQYQLKGGVPSFNGGVNYPGDLKFADLNKDGIIDQDNDRTYIGNSTPQYFGGFTNNFSYTTGVGTFDLSCLLTFTYGNDIYNAGNYWLSGIQGAFNMSVRNWENAWRSSNRQSTRYANPNSSTLDYVSSYNVEDGSYIRFANLSLGYTLPAGLLRSIKSKNLRLYVTAQNLHVFSNYTGYDPEVSSGNPLLQGYDRINGPRPFGLVFGLNASF